MRHVNDFRALTPDPDHASQHRLLKMAHAAGHLDSEQLYIACEAPGCDRSVSVADAYSLALVYRMPGRGVGAFQCPEEQHFGCSHEHAVAAANACFVQHIGPIHAQLLAAAAPAAQIEAAQIEAAAPASSDAAQSSGV